jgi:hypothetical protein
VAKLVLGLCLAVTAIAGSVAAGFYLLQDAALAILIVGAVAMLIMVVAKAGPRYLRYVLGACLLGLLFGMGAGSIDERQFAERERARRVARQAQLEAQAALAREANDRRRQAALDSVPGYLEAMEAALVTANAEMAHHYYMRVFEIDRDQLPANARARIDAALARAKPKVQPPPAPPPIVRRDPEFDPAAIVPRQRATASSRYASRTCLHWATSMGASEQARAGQELLGILRSREGLPTASSGQNRAFVAGISQQCNFDVQDWGGGEALGEVAALLYSLGSEFQF